MKKLLKDPLLHFLLIGAVLFIVFGLFKAPTANQENRIEITLGDIEALSANFTRAWQRAPTEQELAGLVEEKIRDEIAYREGVAMGLDQNDLIIRRRLRMKMELLLEDIAGLVPPTDEDLQDFLENNRAAFRKETRVAFKQIYFNSDKRGLIVSQDAQELLGRLRETGLTKELELYGDPTMLPPAMYPSTLGSITRTFGSRFSESISQLAPGRWEGPIPSGYGLHLVLVERRIEARDPELSEVRELVEREWAARQKKDLKERTYSELRERYTIEIEQPIPAGNG